MEQLILHLWGDYITQTNWMAINKRKNVLAAFLHALVYSIPFILLKPSLIAWLVILVTHFIIDHWALARYLMFFKNWCTEPSLRWVDCQYTGYHKDQPIWLTTWLLIISDNCMHMSLNYCALRWL